MLSVGDKKIILFPNSDQMYQSWDSLVEIVPGVLNFNQDTRPYLTAILDRFKSCDPYMISPAYHSFTGRNGLWGYARGRSLVIFARNPNNLDQIMFYPQLGDPFPNLAFDLIERLPVPKGGYQFSRIEFKKADFLAATMNKKSQHYTYEVVTEPLLDWAFPVHTISTNDILNPIGKRFKSFRQPINIFPKNKVEIKPINPLTDSEELVDVIKHWAYEKKDSINSDDLVGTYASFLKLMSDPCLSLEGVKFYFDGELTAFEAWAMPTNGSKIACNLAGFNKSNIRGFSEFQHYTICKILHDRGVERICLGGSECSGLDAFKRKMNPVESLDLVTISVTPIKNS